jgi:hypothetical protein
MEKSLTENSIDLSCRRDQLKSWAEDLSFRHALRHFKDHKDHPTIGAKDQNDYVNKAKQNILDTFENGFVVRTENNQRAAFFPLKRGDHGYFVGNMTTVQDFNGQAAINTFYPANGSTPLKTAWTFNHNYRHKSVPTKFSELAYIAYFKNGLSIKGWQLLNDDYVFEGEYQSPQATPKKFLESSIDFLSIGLKEMR